MRKRYSEEHIIRILKTLEGDRSARERCREAGISEQTYYRWKIKFWGMEVSEAKRMRELEAENRRLKELVAGQSLDNKILKEIIKKKLIKPAAKREKAELIMLKHSISELTGMFIHRNSQKYQMLSDNSE